MSIKKVKRLNWFQLFFHKLKRKILKRTISAKLDKNQKIVLDQTNLSDMVKNAITIFKHILSNDLCHIYHNRKNGDLIITDQTSKAFIQDTDGNVHNLYIYTDQVFIVHIDSKTLLYLKWLVARRSDINFNKSLNEIHDVYSKQISSTLLTLKTTH